MPVMEVDVLGKILKNVVPFSFYKSISSGGLHMGLYSKIWRFGAKIHLQQGL
jgi:hypothetical protein